jgi:hypothetical protein
VGAFPISDERITDMETNETIAGKRNKKLAGYFYEVSPE